MRVLFSLVFMISLSMTTVANAAEEGIAPVTAEAGPSTSLDSEAVAETSEATTPVLTKATVDDRKESEIPLNLDANKKASSEGSGAFRIIFTIAILSLVGVGGYFFLRKYKIPKASKHQTQIKILQQHFLGPKKSLAIVRVAGESILIGITDQNISMIKSLSLMDDEVPQEAPQNFGKVLTGLGDGSDFDQDEEETPKKSRKASAKELDEEEEFAISGIKDIVSKRLKGMRNLR